jgi:hypothetical protein
MFCDKITDQDLYDTGKTPFHPLRMNETRSVSGLHPDLLEKLKYSTPPDLNSGEEMGRGAWV